jgi:hypothetical protein
MPYRMKDGQTMAGENGNFGPGQRLPDDFDAKQLEALKRGGYVEEFDDAPAEADEPADAPEPETATAPGGATAEAPKQAPAKTTVTTTVRK